MEVKTRIINKAAELYSNFGINAVTNDDIAKSLGISKATIYKHFDNKAEIVSQVVESELSQHLSNMLHLAQNAPNVIEGVLSVWDYFDQARQDTNPNFYRDIQRSYPHAWEVVVSFENDLQDRVLRPEIKTGMSLGYFHSDTDEVFTANLWLALNGFEFPLKHEILKRHFIRGLLTYDGFIIYENL